MLINSREIIQITELIMYFLQFQCEDTWTLSSNLFKMFKTLDGVKSHFT